MYRFGFTPRQRRATWRAIFAPPTDRTSQDAMRPLPAPGETIFEIGFVLAAHLVLALAIGLMVDAFG